MRTIRTLVALIVLLAAAAVGFAYSGIYDVAAITPEPQWLQLTFSTVKDHSIERRAAAITAPPLSDPKALRTGLGHFREMCVSCHGAPGVEAAEFAKGLNPKPPDLAREAAEQSPAQLFWVVKNGIKMTGMPGFGGTHTDEQVWAVVAFLKQLPQLTPEKYQAMVREAGAAAGGREDRPGALGE
ncbi:MAG TPA: cytochrome c [Thermoanaerobaculia bacterium]|nr:cytochrome c [Thermoanaerobaculia bacterium]